MQPMDSVLSATLDFNRQDKIAPNALIIPSQPMEMEHARPVLDVPHAIQSQENV